MLCQQSAKAHELLINDVNLSGKPHHWGYCAFDGVKLLPLAFGLLVCALHPRVPSDSFEIA